MTGLCSKIVFVLLLLTIAGAGVPGFWFTGTSLTLAAIVAFIGFRDRIRWPDHFI